MKWQTISGCSVLSLLLLLELVPPEVRAGEQPIGEEELRVAVNRSLPLIATGANGFLEQRTCFACHSQAIPTVAFRIAKDHGFQVDDAALSNQIERTRKILTGWEQRDPERTRFVGGAGDTAVYTLFTLDIAKQEPDHVTAAVVEYLLKRDENRGYWKPSHDDRLPSEGSPFTTTALALRGLKAFGTPEQQERIVARRAAALEWLRATKPANTEDRVFRLWGLAAAEAASEEIQAAVEDLLKTQRDDGGWNQIEELDSDAYATGSALVALQLAGGLAVDHPAYQRGLRFLLAQQQEDGSWKVTSRSANRFQKQFESGFPHGEDQWISLAATSWATAALALGCAP